MNSAIKNRFRAAEDGWIQLAPFGTFPHPEKRGHTQIFNREQAEEIVRNFRNSSTDVLIDPDHESHDLTKRTEAYGWLNDLQVREDGLWGRARWTDLGEAAIRNGRYRFISPVWDAERRGNQWFPHRLTDAGLTNQPNARGSKPISNRGNPTKTSAEDPADSPQHRETMKQVANALGLQPDAAESVIVGEVEKLKAKGAEFDTLRNRATTLEAENKSLLEAQADADLDRNDITDEEARGRWRPALIANRAATLPLLEDLGKAAKEKAGKGDGENPTASQPIHNRSQAKQPTGGSAEQEKQNAEAEKKAAAIRNRANTIADAEKVPFGQAWNRAAAEIG